MLTFSMTLDFAGRYIAHPYWPEMYQLIEITKKSGINRAKSEANRRKALEEYLRQNGMTLEDFRALEERANRPFHTAPDGEIIIPSASVMAFIVAANDEARAASKVCARGQERTRIVASDFATGKHGPDGVWSRFATVTLGTGAKASNQRGLRENAFIEGFTARGTITIDEQHVDPETLRNLIEWGGQFVGIGASRKMGMGRFQLASFALLEKPLRAVA